MATTVKDLCERYKKYVKENPETTGQVESMFRVLSYILPGMLWPKLERSGTFAEL